jgi:hypothetical protein
MANLPSKPQVIVSTFKIGKWEFQLPVPVDQIPRDSINLFSAITVRLDEPLTVSGRTWPIIVFPARLKEDLTFEQTAEGFPCLNESEAQFVAQAIQDKNRKTPVVALASWSGHFALATLTNEEYFRKELVLFTFHEPKVVNGVRCGHALRIYKYFLDKPREIVWEEILPTTDVKVAQNLLEKKHSELLKHEVEQKKKLKNSAAQSGAELSTSQLKVLSKAYPKTIAYLQSPDKKNLEPAFSAYKQETLAVTGRLVETLSKSEFDSVAAILRNAARRKNPPINDVEFQLVVGWRLRGYDKMTPEQRFEALKELGLKPPSPEAVRKICERLKLPSARKPGAPRKAPP